jgi:hypothetical protein
MAPSFPPAGVIAEIGGGFNRGGKRSQFHHPLR